MASNGEHNNDHHRFTLAGLIISLGIIFGDIGTSPLYVMQTVIGDDAINHETIFGAVSMIFWTLTFQTTLKYVVLALRADNKGEGGIFSLFTLVRRQHPWLIFLAMIGGSAVLAEGMLTPPISVSAAVEGLRSVDYLRGWHIPTILITVVIISALFVFQQFGTGRAARYFGPVMVFWFAMLGVLGAIQIIQVPEILSALNPMRALSMLQQPDALVLMGTVFLCTTGAEVLYADMGHCGRKNIRVSWGFVKTCLVLNYFGQAAWCLQFEGQSLPAELPNPFFDIMPDWFLPIGIATAVVAAIVASQAIISGAFMLVSEAVRLGLLPKMNVIFPSRLKGQLYVPAVNILLWGGCVFVALYFGKSTAMEAAYGLSVTITMLMTTILLANFFNMRHSNRALIGLFLLFYIAFEGSFLIANLLKIKSGGWLTLLAASLLFTLMYVWRQAKKIKNRFTKNIRLSDYLDQLIQLSNDKHEPKYATNLVYLSATKSLDMVEERILYSILQTQPKRADNYWFVHIEVTDEPYTREYEVHTLAPDEVYQITFRLGFRVEQRMNLYFKKVIEELLESGEVNITTRYHTSRSGLPTGDIRFVIIQEFLSNENDLPVLEQITMSVYLAVKSVTASPQNWFGLDSDSVEIEKVPLVLRPVKDFRLRRIT